MKKMKSPAYQLFALSALSVLIAACGGSKEEAGGAPEANAVNPLIQSVFVDAEPAGSISVTEARKSAKPGDTVTISGKIGGAMDPFTEGFATAVLADTALETCDLVPGDHCKTPWDACCVDAEVIKSLRLTIQVVGDENRPVTQSLKGVNGLKELDPVVVTGTVADGSTEENLILNVSGVFKKE
tara:strand:+ start:100 stop:651 length:552 start_codon:yes stop_codon:yes gene_type:complete